MRGLLGVSTIIGLLLAAGPSVASAEPADPPLTGYALPSIPAERIVRDAPGLDTLTLVGSHISAEGRRFSEPTRQVLRRAALARREGLRTELLISSYRDAVEDFDPHAAAALLSHPRRIDRVARQVAGYAEAGDWDGVNVDLERLRRRDGDGLVRLLTRLRAELPEGASLTVDVSPSGTLDGYRARGYRLGEIGRVVDAVQLMTYDQHGPSWSGPGPIGALDWQRRGVEVALQRVPVGRIDLGVAGYGYLWRPAAAEDRSPWRAPAGWWPRTGRGRGGAGPRGSGPPGWTTAGCCGGPTPDPWRCAGRWPPTSASGGTRSGGSARRTRWADHGAGPEMPTGRTPPRVSGRLLWSLGQLTGTAVTTRLRV